MIRWLRGLSRRCSRLSSILLDRKDGVSVGPAWIRSVSPNARQVIPCLIVALVLRAVEDWAVLQEFPLFLAIS